MMTLAQQAQGEARRVLVELAKVKDGHRRFCVDEQGAALYGIAPQLLAELKALGLASCQGKDGECFDPDDLYNLSLYLRLPSLHKLAMRSWSSAFRDSERDRCIELSYALDAVPEHAITILLPSGELRVCDTPDQMQVHQEQLILPGHQRLLPSPFIELIEHTCADMRFFMLHDALRWDLAFMVEHRVAECGGFSKLLVQQALMRGMPARQVFGLLLSAPYATGHYWAELLVEDQWVAVDPLMIRLLCSQAGLDETRWPLHRSPATALLRLSCVDAYDQDGAPCLSCFEGQQFRQLPVVTAGDRQHPVSFKVAVQPPISKL
ncbi:transglutaminase-like enzyme, putative cysteine protease [Pseudomonas asplenii]|uniref:Transglutaminase-like enzyme, putative cysteine protease n=2 Tax=Pseudomonas TaxID=286 RepID=A0A0M9GII4_9PSED|nr:transglutaminase-like enzyme, putative cysteine protease [Pseudomonas fuscovaginae]KPA95983.1 transglutaminase-like enzyme, predicted cysteine protease [Pseudomonas fuscovaginae]